MVMHILKNWLSEDVDGNNGGESSDDGDGSIDDDNNSLYMVQCVRVSELYFGGFGLISIGYYVLYLGLIFIMKMLMATLSLPHPHCQCSSSPLQPTTFIASFQVGRRRQCSAFFQIVRGRQRSVPIPKRCCGITDQLSWQQNKYLYFLIVRSLFFFTGNMLIMSKINLIAQF